MIHKISFSYDRKQIESVAVMLCSPKDTGTNTDAKSVNWDHVTCPDCLKRRKTELMRMNSPLEASNAK